MKTIEAQITKDGRDVAEVAMAMPMQLGPNERWPLLSGLDCYYFPRMKLTNPVIWEVLAGTALMKFLDHCELRMVAENSEAVIEDLRYVHGRAELMKGRPTISTVLLVKVGTNQEVPPEVWLSYLPAIYEEFMRGYELPKKSA